MKLHSANAAIAEVDGSLTNTLATQPYGNLVPRARQGSVLSVTICTASTSLGILLALS